MLPLLRVNVQVSVIVNHHPVSRQNHYGSGRLFNYGRTAELRLGFEQGAVEYVGLMDTVSVEIDLAASLDSVLGAPSRASQCGYFWFAHRAVRSEMIVDNLDRRIQSERVLPFVGIVEATGSLAQFLRFGLANRKWHLHGVLLPQVTHVGVPVEDEALGPHPVLPKLLGRCPLELSKGFT